MKYTIISDSSCDLFPSNYKSDKFDFITVPLTINIDGKEFADDENLDINGMMAAMKASKSAVKTSCPPPETFLDTMRNSDNIICITISSRVSGCFNSARLAAETALKENPEKNIYVLDSLLTSAGLALVLHKLMEKIESEDFESFKELCDSITEFNRSIHVRFMLQDFSNVIKTGRMGKFAGIIASLLIIKPICGDDGNGEIKICHKALGSKKALKVLANCAGEKIKSQGKIPIIINHCRNQADALFLKEILEKEYGLTDIIINPMRGIISVYASDQGVLIGY